MNDRPLIVGGLLLFVVFVTSPIWHGVATRKLALAPLEIKLPSQEKNCVAPASYMRTSHMQLLEQWRSDVVRRQQRQYTAYDGKVYEKNLTQTCLSQCHASHADFCDKCHRYAGVAALNCWNCHSDAPLPARNAP
ncbi:MAG: sulfate reduction electron transfer complex DsrMKJOP subunit DsrJ [Candidatus Korobacteraceae bacterium]|jgi:hypothetical protein